MGSDLRSDADGRTAMVIVLSEGAAADAAARDRLAGVVNDMHIDTVLARGGHGQDFGRMGRKYVADEGDPEPADGALLAPWVERDAKQQTESCHLQAPLARDRATLLPH